MTAFSVFSLLLVIGLAIDAGNLYRARLAMQRAADSASLAAINYITVYGSMQAEQDAGVLQASNDAKKAAITPLLTTRAQSIVRANLAGAGYPSTATNPISVSGEYLPAGDPAAQSTSAYEYRVSVTKKIDYLLMGLLLPANSDKRQISVTSTARRRVANVALLIDVSDSMNCPAEGSCDCLRSSTSGPGSCPSPTKMDKLLEGVGLFLHHLDMSIDRIAIVPYNMQANVLNKQSLRALGISWPDNPPPSLIDDIIGAIRALYVPGSNTNLCNALITSQSYVRASLGVPQGEPVAYVLFSDGGPTAGQFLFNDAKPQLAPFPSPGIWDYTSTSIAWVDSSHNARPGPGLLVQTGMYPINYPLAYPTLNNNSLQPNPIATISKCTNPNLTYPPRVARDSDLEAATQFVFQPCLNSFRAYVPGGKDTPSKWYDGNYKTEAGSQPGTANWRETYYNCAIELADFIREDKGTFFTIGLGEVNDAVDPDDPYQNVGDSQSLKSVFLARLSLDPKQGADDPKFTYDGYDDYSVASAKAPGRNGDFLPTPRNSDIPLMFQRIVHRVLLKLVS